MLACLVTLLLGSSTEFFTGRRLAGPDAMGYFVVFLALALRWIATLVAVICCLCRGSFRWISSRPAVSWLVVIGGHIGLGLVSLSACGMWIESRGWYATPAANLGTLLLPILVQAYLLIALWMPPEEIARQVWPKIFGGIFAAAGGLGVIGGAVALVQWQFESAREQVAAIEEAESRQAEFEKEEAERIQLQAAKLANLSDDEPLESFLPHLFIDKTEEHHRQALKRIGGLPDLDSQIERATQNPDPLQREYALNYIRLCDQPAAAWAANVRRAVELLADDIQAAETLYDPVTQRSFRGMVLGVLKTAQKFPDADFDQPVRRVRDAVLEKPDDQTRAETLRALENFLKGDKLPP